mmetsp:Transcript_14445/g.36153  ORF Transcript_14445/g.36153 Transcript_14445/m.36153 type:complete len:229 (-) Transcript_14445:587-1273(-)
MKYDVHGRRGVVRGKGRDADAKIGVHSIFEFQGCSSPYSFPFRFYRPCCVSTWLQHRFLYPLHVATRFSAIHDPVDMDRWQVDPVGSQLADFHDLLHLTDAGFFRSRRHYAVEIVRGRAKNHIAELVGLPTLDEGVVAIERGLHDVALAVKSSVLERAAGELGERVGLLADRKSSILYHGPRSCWCVERWNPRSRRADFLCQRSLWCQLDFQFPGEVLPLKLLVFADV